MGPPSALTRKAGRSSNHALIPAASCGVSCPVSSQHGQPQIDRVCIGVGIGTIREVETQSAGALRTGLEPDPGLVPLISGQDAIDDQAVDIDVEYGLALLVHCGYEGGLQGGRLHAKYLGYPGHQRVGVAVAAQVLLRPVAAMERPAVYAAGASSYDAAGHQPDRQQRHRAGDREPSAS